MLYKNLWGGVYLSIQTMPLVPRSQHTIMSRLHILIWKINMQMKLQTMKSTKSDLEWEEHLPLFCKEQGQGQSSRDHTLGIPHQTPNPLTSSLVSSSSPPLLIIQKMECRLLLAKTNQSPLSSWSGPHTQGAPVQGHKWGWNPAPTACHIMYQRRAGTRGRGSFFKFVTSRLEPQKEKGWKM